VEHAGHHLLAGAAFARDQDVGVVERHGPDLLDQVQHLLIGRHELRHVALLGLQDTDATVDLETVIFNGLALKGIYGRKVWDTWIKMTTMLQAGLDISQIITHHFDVRDYEKGFEAMISGQSGKVILDWQHLYDEKEQ
jgi:threonine 3-dehydrogenase